MGAKLLHHDHSGRLRPHANTTYAGLGFLLLLTIIVLTALTYSASADATDPVSYTVGASAAVAQKVPNAPTITSPGSGQEISKLPVDVGGICAKGYVVKVFANDILVGANSCAGGSYSVPVSLFFGRNTVRAQSFNLLDQGGKSSAAVGLTYAPSAGQGINLFQQFGDSRAKANQLFIKADVFHKSAASGQDTAWPIEIVGGTAPYAVNISWGDGKTDVYSRSATGRFEVKHRYDSTGAGENFQVVVKAADAVNDQAYLQVVSVSNVKAANAKSAGGLVIAWPLIGAGLLMVISFYLGDRYERKTLMRRGELAGA